MESQLQEVRRLVDAHQAEGGGGGNVAEQGKSFQASHDVMEEHLNKMKIEVLADCEQCIKDAVQVQVQEQASSLEDFASCHIRTLRLLADRVQDVSMRVDQVFSEIGMSTKPAALVLDSRSRRDSEMTQLPDEASPSHRGVENQERQVTSNGAPVDHAEVQQEQRDVEPAPVIQETNGTAEAKPDQISISKALCTVQQQKQTSEMRELSQAMLSGQPSKLNTASLTTLATEMHKSLKDLMANSAGLMATSADAPRSQRAADTSDSGLRSSSPGATFAVACHPQASVRSPRLVQVASSPRRIVQVPAQSGGCSTALPGSYTAPSGRYTSATLAVAPPGMTGVTQSWQGLGVSNVSSTGFASPTVPCGAAGPRHSVHLGVGCQAAVQVLRQPSPNPLQRHQRMSSGGMVSVPQPSPTVSISRSNSLLFQQTNAHR